MAMYLKWALAIRGPFATKAEYILPRSVYNTAVIAGMTQLYQGGAAQDVVKYVLDLIVQTSSYQKLPQTEGNHHDFVGPSQAFGVLAMDKNGYFSVSHRKHPNLQVKENLVEDFGLYTGSKGCISIAGPHQRAQAAANLLGLDPYPRNLCWYISKFKDFSGVSINENGAVGIATGKSLMPWAIGSPTGRIAYGHEARQCNEYPMGF